MSLPRRVLPGATSFITRRTQSRRFLLRPDPETIALFLYCLGVAAARYRIRVHSLCVMSNHYHLIATDPEGWLPLFLQYFHRLVALGIQRQRTWDEVVWEPNRQTSVVELLTDAAVVEKTLYLLTNPVSAGLVSDCDEWPGVVRSGAFGVERPGCFHEGCLPARTEVSFVPAPAVSGEQVIADAVALGTPGALAAARGRTGRRPIGARRALRISPRDVPQTAKSKWNLSPRLAAMSRAVLAEGKAALRAFRSAYRIAFDSMRGGLLVPFPAGTWKLVRQFGLPGAT